MFLGKRVQDEAEKLTSEVVALGKPRALMVAVLGDAGVYMARWHEDRVWAFYWDPRTGWRVVQGYDLRDLLEPHRIEPELVTEWQRWLSGAATRGLLEEPMPIKDTTGLIKMESKKGWESELAVDGPVKRFEWKGGEFREVVRKPEWAKRPSQPPARLPQALGGEG